jgi:hypothetical protein
MHHNLNHNTNNNDNDNSNDNNNHSNSHNNHHQQQQQQRHPRQQRSQNNGETGESHESAAAVNSNNVQSQSQSSMANKRGVRDLNTRLQMYVRSQADKKSNVERLKKAMATQEMEFQKKFKHAEQNWNNINGTLRKEKEALGYTLERATQDRNTAQKLLFICLILF